MIEHNYEECKVDRAQHKTCVIPRCSISGSI